MAHLACYEFTQLPIDIIDILDNDISEYNLQTDTSLLIDNKVNKKIRNSNNAWIPESHWIAGWLWYYVEKVNRGNFCYDILDIDGGTLQYTHYGPGQYYNWHRDDDVDTMYIPEQKIQSKGNIGKDLLTIQGEMVRKLSFSLQLSDPEDYKGGELEFIDNSNKPFLAPKQRGTMVVFDSRVRHRVRKVKSGLRKSIVGWVIGPRWK
tara:strand:- start:1534 stop:2151 length:618 start_codon:yes stop_codon:yes gene_type:complete